MAKQKLSNEMLRDAIGMLSDFESPETFFSAEKLSKAVSEHFDAEVTEEEVKEFVRPYNADVVDRYLMTKNILT